MIDAEHTPYQPALDSYTLLLSEMYNRPPHKSLLGGTDDTAEWRGPLILYVSFLRSGRSPSDLPQRNVPILPCPSAPVPRSHAQACRAERLRPRAQGRPRRVLYAGTSDVEKREPARAGPHLARVRLPLPLPSLYPCLPC